MHSKIRNIFFGSLFVISFSYFSNSAIGCEGYNEKFYLESDYKGEKDYVVINNDNYHMTKEEGVFGIRIKDTFYPLKEELMCHKVQISGNKTSVWTLGEVTHEECKGQDFKILPKHFVRVKRDAYESLGEDYYSFTFDYNK